MNSQEATDLIYRSSPSVGEFSVRRLIEKSITEKGEKVTLSIDEAINDIERDVGNRIAETQADLKERGARPFLESVGAGNLKFRWTSLGDRSGLSKNWLRSRCLRWLDGLDSHEFEKACALALTANGASDACASRKSGDFNIDFYGLLPAHSRASLILNGAKGCRIVGQAKKYASRVTREKILTLIECISALSKRQPEAKDAAPIWFYEHKIPIVAVVVGFSGFQSGARNYAADHGVILLDGNDLAYLLAVEKFLEWPTNDAQFASKIDRAFQQTIRLE